MLGERWEKPEDVMHALRVARSFLQLIAEGYKVDHFDDRYVYVENPNDSPEQGPNLMLDIRTLWPPEDDEPDGDDYADRAAWKAHRG